MDDLVQTEDAAATTNPEVSQPISTNLVVIILILVSVPITDDFFDNASIPSPTAIVSTPITIAPCPPPISSQVQTTVVSSTPLFTDSTATTSTTNMTNEPPVTFNASNVGVAASGITIGHSTPPISPLRQDDSDTFFKGDGFGFRTFQIGPFTVQEDSDDDAPVTQCQFKVITEKLDSLINSSQASSSDAYSKAAVEAFFQPMTKEHQANLDKVNQAVSDSTIMCKGVIEGSKNCI